MLISARSRTVVLIALVLAVDLPCVSQISPASIDAQSIPKATDRLVLTATVIDKKGDFVTGLQRDALQIFVDKEPANIVDFSETDVPLSVGIVMDFSASVVAPGAGRTMLFINALQQALKSFFETSNKSNEYFLLAFNAKPQLLLDWTSDPQLLVHSLSNVSPKGITAFYDACYLAIDKVQHGRNPKRVLILVSDGLDNNSTYSRKQVREALRESDVLLYSVNFSYENYAGDSLGTEGQEILNELSSVSGGMFFYKKEGVRLKVSDAASVFEVIATELAHQYTIGITPQSPRTAGRWHKIKVMMKPSREMKRLSVRTREGFYLNHR